MLKQRTWMIACAFVVGLTYVICAAKAPGLAQGVSSPYWSSQQTIPDYGDETNPPVLIADQAGTVHAFASQLYDESILAIIYNQWTLGNGWTTPNAILLSPENEARVLDVLLDAEGTFHLIFFGGDETDAQIYYSQAAAVQAGQAPAWSYPAIVGEVANNPELAAIFGDDQGNLAIVYSGRLEGFGLYTLFSADGGESWTEPAPSFLTYDDTFPAFMKLYSGQSGAIHAVWDVRDEGGNGRQINYATLNLVDRRWSELERLAESAAGYGVLLPTIVEHDGELIVAYSGITMRRSSDGGKSWTEPVKPFRQVGVNGAGSFVVDSENELHLFWAQRVTGTPDIHGVWHSRRRNGIWTEPEPVISGPPVHDLVGDKAYDPVDPKAVIVRGNTFLVTWRQDPGAKGNGVWYSYRTSNSPELPSFPLPTPVTKATAYLPSVARSTAPTQTPLPTPLYAAQVVETPKRNRNTASFLAIAMFPTILFISAVVFFRGLRHRHRP